MTWMWRIDLLGGFAIAREGRDLATALGRREKALLGYLALSPGQSVSRDHLAEVIFQHTTGAPALREAARRIRHLLGDPNILLKDSNPLKLGVDPAAIDALRFEELSRGNDEESLTLAANLYRGELLLGVDPRSDAFEDWLRDRREQFRQVAFTAHYRLAQLRHERGDPEGALVAVKCLGSLRDDDEQGCQLEMRILGSMRRYSDVRATWDRLCHVLNKNHGVVPSADTKDVYDAIAASAATGSGRERSAPSASTPPLDVAKHGSPAPARDARPGGSRTKSAWSWRGLVPIAVASGLTIVGIAASVLGAFGVIFWRVPELAPAPLGMWVRDAKTYVQGSAAPSIVVMQFESSGDLDAATYADALSEGLQSTLSIASDIVVYSDYPVAAATVSFKSLREVAGRVGARYVLEGHLFKEGSSFSVSTSLVDTYLTEKIVWGHSYSRNTDDFVSLQHDVMLDVTVSLEVQLTEGEQARISYGRGTHVLDAWVAASQAVKYVRKFTQADNARARALYADAAEIDPDYAGAWEGVAWTHFIDARFGWSTSREESLRTAAGLAQHVLAIDPDRARTYALLGSLALVQADHDTAISLGEQAVAMEPNDADSLALLAYTLTYTDDVGRALALVERAIKLRPTPPHWYIWLRGRALRMGGDLGKAIELLKAESSINAFALAPLVELTEAYAERGDLDRAREVADKILKIEPRFSVGAWTAIPRHRNADDQAHEAELLSAAGLPR